MLDYNLVRFGVCMIKLRHERMLILRWAKKTLNYRQKKVNPLATTWKISNILTRNSSHWEYLNSMRNLKLLKKYQPPHPAIKKKENLNLQENKKTSLLVKVSTTLKLPQPLWKSLKPPTWKILNFSKNPNSIGKIFNSFEVTRPINPSLHEKISNPENLTPFRKLQSFYAHEDRN